MKKSEIFKKAQLSVIHDTRLMDYEKLEILRELMNKEDWELLMESKKESEG